MGRSGRSVGVILYQGGGGGRWSERLIEHISCADDTTICERPTNQPFSEIKEKYIITCGLVGNRHDVHVATGLVDTGTGTGMGYFLTA